MRGQRRSLLMTRIDNVSSTYRTSRLSLSLQSTDHAEINTRAPKSLGEIVTANMQ